MGTIEQNQIRILIIEDNPGDARLIQEMFSQSATHGRAAVSVADQLCRGLEHLEHENADVILLDLGLPDSDGLDSFNTIQAIAPSTPVIVITGLRDEEIIRRALRDGAQDYLIKGQIDADRLARSVRYAIERKHAEDQLRAITDVQRLLLSELDHRVRNNLASLISLIDIGQRQYDSVDRFADTMRMRVQTMATVHTLLSRSQWTNVNLERLIQSLVPPDLRDKVHIAGRKLVVPVRQVHALGMVMHEFIANSIKYGALSSDGGALHISWTIDDTDPADLETAEGRVVHLEWHEKGGPRVEPPQASGVGTKIITGFAASELRGTVVLNYPESGVHHRLTFSLDAEDEVIDTRWSRRS